MGILIALAPMFVSMMGGFLVLNHGIIAPFNAIADRHHQQITPLQELRLRVWEAISPLDDHFGEGDARHADQYRALRTRIEADFVGLITALGDEPETQSLVKRARDDWSAADRDATQIISVAGTPDDPARREAIARFHGRIAAASDRLGAVFAQLREDVATEHRQVSIARERTMWIAAFACLASLIATAAGVQVIGRILSGSVDRLVDGAIRFAEGDHHHRIDVQVPPELCRVADEFNRMIGRIHESESILADLAHRDSLTGLENRRAFDGAFDEITARLQRHQEPVTLLAIDIDHFKRVNDTWGHPTGDEVLKAVARIIRDNLRPFDKAFRIGGEEFLAVLPDTRQGPAREVAERLRKAVEKTTLRIGDQNITTTISIGVAEASDQPALSGVMLAADEALYRAKHAGRNRTVVSGEKAGGTRDAA